MAEQYDLAAKDIERLKANAKRRLELRNEFLKQQSDPFRHASGEGGHVFDPAIQRFGAMRLSSFEHFKANAKNVRTGLFCVVIPLAATMYIFKTQRERDEEKYRTGQVAYKDRRFKFI
ncbi:uncharacterized protein [Atheta coriaria]|uniref:uncharacterized protein n=1 Tax=Dalotia coriaria TaxID=877792 RepID=UPI0031F398F1